MKDETPPPSFRPAETPTERIRRPVRVAVEPSSAASDVLVVRPIREGERVPPGAREAVLVFIDDDDAQSQRPAQPS